MVESVSNGFRQTEVPTFHFSPVDFYQMKRSQNWPDLRSPIWKFWDIHLIDIVMDINRWKLQGDQSFGAAVASIQFFFSEVKSLGVTWWPDLKWSGSEKFTRCAEKMHKQVPAPPFFRYLRKPWGGAKHPPARRGLIKWWVRWCLRWACDWFHARCWRLTSSRLFHRITL